MALPPAIQQKAREAYRLFAASPDHPSLHFKKLPPHVDVYSARITKGYRTIGRVTGDVIVWFFIGTHAEYDKVLDRL
jgi:hypothetical protein